MTVTVAANGLSIVHLASNGISMATVPDVCKTPSAGGAPVPYPNISMSSSLTDGTKTVTADGGNMIAINGSQFSVSSGDEPGAAGGVTSSTFKKESTWITYSFDVMMDGSPVCRLTDKKFQNHKNTVDCGGIGQSNVAGAGHVVENRGDSRSEPKAIGDSDWKFNPEVDEDLRGAEGAPAENYKRALDLAFEKTGVPKDEFTITAWAKDINGKTTPVEWKVKSGPYKGAEVNVDDPRIVPARRGPADPHIGWQTPGKRSAGGARRGHILLDDVPVSRARLRDKKVSKT